MRVLLADDHALVRARFRALLDGMTSFEVVAGVANGPGYRPSIEHQSEYSRNAPHQHHKPAGNPRSCQFGSPCDEH